MITKLTHIGVAVKSLNESIALFSRLLQSDCVETEVIESQKVKLAFFRVGDAAIELTEPTDSLSPIAKFIEKRGEGVHHLSFEVQDIEAEIVRLKREGFQMIDEKPRIGAGGHLIAFLHPKSTGGILIEISQHSPGV